MPPAFSVRARCRRLRSPPDSIETRFCWSGPLKPNEPTYARLGSSRLPTFIFSSPSLIASNTVFFGSRSERAWST